MFKVIIAGGRYYRDAQLMEVKCDNILANIPDVEIVSGGQCTEDSVTGEIYGADHLGEQYAKKRGFGLKVFQADWKKHGKRAGPLRNREMSEYADALIAFWDGQSRGTGDMIRQATERGLKIRVIRYSM